MYRILLVDDDKEVLSINRAYLRGKGYEVDTALTVKEAAACIARAQPDCIVMDVMMPGMDGFEGYSYLRKKSDAPILFLTGKTEEEDRIRGLMLGAEDYIVKPYSLQELSLRILIHIRRQEKVEQKAGTLLFPPLRIELLEHRAFYNEQELPLSNREFDLLALLARHPQETMTFEQIGTALFGTYLDTDRKNVMVTASRLRKKLEGCVGLERMIETVWGQGYCFRGEPSAGRRG